MSVRGRPCTRSFEDAGNRTILIGVKLLQAVARMEEAATLTEIALSTGFSTSRAHRYLRSLTQTGLLRYELQTGKYELGPASLELGIAAMARLDALRLSLDVMRELTGRLRLVSILSVWGSNGPTVVKWEQARLDLSIRIREGMNLSLPITAAGQVFLTYLDPALVRPILDRNLRAWNASAPSGKRINKKDIDAIRQDVVANGIAHAAGQYTPYTASLSAPVFDHSGGMMALSLVGMIGSFDESITGEPARELKAATKRLTELLGGRASRSHEPAY